jgi:membrane protease YdiL (CAAX protease family)
MKTILTIGIVLTATTLLLSANKFLPTIGLRLHQNEYFNGILKYQLFAVFIAAVVILVTLKWTPQSRELLRFGNINTLAIKEMWLGINGKTSWKSNGLQLAVFISLATATFMYLAIKQTNSLSNFNVSFIPIILLISLTNSFAEEAIYRFAINGNLMPHTLKWIILVASAILFGLPHYLGYPNGVVGVLMAATLGYILSKATYETQGIGIAWSIHFVQDVIIFTALSMINIKS